MAELKASIRISLLDHFSAPLRGMASNMDRFKKTLGAVKFPSVARFAADLNQAGEAMSRVGRTVAAGLKTGVDEFAGFEKQMSRIKAVAPEVKDNGAFERLRTQAIQWGADTAFSAEEAGKAMENFLARGFNEEQTLKLGRISLDFAVGNDLGLERSAEIIGGVTKAFNTDLDGATVATDILSAAAAKSASNAEYLSASLIRVGPLARKLSMDLSVLSAGASVFAEAQVPAEEAATAFKAILLDLSSFAKPARDALTELGYGKDQLEDLQAMLSRGDLAGMLQSIGTAMQLKGVDKGTKSLEVMKAIFGVHQADKAQILIDASMDPNAAVSLQKFQEEFKKVEEQSKAGEHFTERMAKEMGDNMSGEIERTSGALSSLRLILGDALAPALRDALLAIQALAGRIGAFAQANPELARTIVLLTAAFAGTAVAGGGLLFTLSALTTGFGVLAKTVGFSLKAFSLVFKTFGFLAKAFVWFGRVGPMLLNLGRFVGTFLAYFGGIGGILSSIASGVVSLGTTVFAGIEVAIGAIAAALSGPVAIVAGLVALVGAGVYYALKWTGTLDDVTSWFSEQFGALMTGLGELASEAASVLGDLLGPNVVGYLMEAWTHFGEFLVELWDGVASAFMSVIDPIAEYIDTLVSSVKSLSNFSLGGIFGGDESRAEPAAKQEQTAQGQKTEQQAAAPMTGLREFATGFADWLGLPNEAPKADGAGAHAAAPKFDLFANTSKALGGELAKAKLPTKLVLPHHSGKGGGGGEADDPVADAKYYAAQKAYQDSMGADYVVGRYADGSRDEKREDGTVVRVQPPSAPAKRRAKSGGVKLPKVTAPEFAAPVIAEAKPKAEKDALPENPFGDDGETAQKAEPGLLPPNPYDGETLGELPENPFDEPAQRGPDKAAARKKRGKGAPGTESASTAPTQPLAAAGRETTEGGSQSPATLALGKVNDNLSAVVLELKELTDDADRAHTENRQLGELVLRAMADLREILYRSSRVSRPLTGGF